MYHSRILFCIFVLMAFFKSSVGYASNSSLIDFEQTPLGMTPVDDTPLNDFYPSLDGVEISFGFDQTGDGAIDAPAYFERIGRNGDDAYSGTPAGDNDTAEAGFATLLGNYFLRPPGHFSEVVPPTAMIIDLNPPLVYRVTRVKGEIWDIDTGGTNYEEFTVTAYSIDGEVLDEMVSPRGINPATNPVRSLNRRPWFFTLQSEITIDRVVIDYTGNKPSGTGVAFNNLSIETELTPEPSSAYLLVIAIGGLMMDRRAQLVGSPVT